MVQLQPLSTVDRIGHLLKVDLPADDGAAVAALGWASDLVRIYTGQDITRVIDDVVLLTPTANRVIELPQQPVISVTQIEIVNWYTPDVWTVVAPADYRLSTVTGRIRPAGIAYWPAGWPTHDESFRVTYTHGLETVPDGIAGATASIAARIMTMPPGILNERNGQRGATFRAEEFLTPMERLTLGNYREARIA